MKITFASGITLFLMVSLFTLISLLEYERRFYHFFKELNTTPDKNHHLN